MPFIARECKVSPSLPKIIYDITFLVQRQNSLLVQCFAFLPRKKSQFVQLGQLLISHTVESLCIQSIFQCTDLVIFLKLDIKVKSTLKCQINGGGPNNQGGWKTSKV